MTEKPYPMSSNTVAEILAIVIKEMPEHRRDWALDQFAEVYAEREALTITQAKRRIKTNLKK